MSHRKRSSKLLDKANRRVAALRSINPKLDLGSGVTLEVYEASIEKVRTDLDAYNMVLSEVDAANNALIEAEKSLADLSERMLAGVATKYGKDSDEYEKAGGVRKSERKRAARKVNTQTKPDNPSFSK